MNYWDRMKQTWNLIKSKPSLSPDFDLDKVKIYFNNGDANRAYQVLTEQTCVDLNLDDFFIHINKTFSCVGQQYLYDRLRRIPLETSIAEDDKVLQFLKEHKDATERIKKFLSKLSHMNAYSISTLFQKSHPEISSVMKTLLKILQFLPMLSIVFLIIFQHVFFLITTCIFFVVNMIFHYRNKMILSAYLHSVPQFFRLVSVAKKISSEKPFDQFRPEIKKSLQSIQSLINDLSYFKYEDKVANESAMIFFLGKELLNIFFLLEPNILFRSFRLLEEKKSDIENIFSYVGHIDMLQSLAHIQEDFPYYCKPRWTETGLHAIDVYHPLIEDCVANTLNTNGKSILLTGSNMSGKTTFIRTIALNVLCAAALNMCFSRSFNCRRMMIHSAINLHDNLLESKSFYMKEVLAVKQMLEKSQKNGDNLFLLDEIFKGTNTPERIASGKAVLSELAKNGNIVFASTHDIELADLLAGEYELYHFCEQIETDRLYFDYLLKHGKLKYRNAIRLLEIEGYPPSVIAEAKLIAGTNHSTK
ncbi:MAG: hypothetical protein LBV20_03560 [Treponema sp.]|jgi:hypothetical protein|nr:hypothetical protein [Treponema sp.]